MDLNLALGVGLAVLTLFVILRLLAGRLKHLGTVALRSLVAFFGIWAANIIGGSFGFHIGLNPVTALTVGILGIPGAVLILAVKYLI
ncbi:MAG: pro-sigmaK processing inhibitor BofA family protein [Bacillota bacterium]|nr:pro-sigmaK processing inhibitor BofA [Candidatus Fermentithermobacillaceae bacterium]